MCTCSNECKNEPINVDEEFPAEDGLERSGSQIHTQTWMIRNIEQYELNYHNYAGAIPKVKYPGRVEGGCDEEYIHGGYGVRMKVLMNTWTYTGRIDDKCDGEYLHRG